MTYVLLDRPVHLFRIAVRKGADHRLAGIFSKSIHAMPANLVEDIAAGYTSYKAKNVAFWGLAQLHPGVAGGDVLLVLLLIVFL